MVARYLVKSSTQFSGAHPISASHNVRSRSGCAHGFCWILDKVQSSASLILRDVLESQLILAPSFRLLRAITFIIILSKRLVAGVAFSCQYWPGALSTPEVGVDPIPPAEPGAALVGV